jgi:hypothetical protein
LVEHDLAKVGVASSSLVFRSTQKSPEFFGIFCRFVHHTARVVELVDTKDLKSFGHCGRAGSSPASGTSEKLMGWQLIVAGSFFYA